MSLRNFRTLKMQCRSSVLPRRKNSPHSKNLEIRMASDFSVTLEVRRYLNNALKFLRKKIVFPWDHMSKQTSNLHAIKKLFFLVSQKN